MDRRHARYPFLSAAREAVREADVDLAAVVEREPPVLDRARNRVLGSVRAGDVGDPDRDARTELLSYPVARVLVSLVDEPVCTAKYARAEAAAARERLEADAQTGDTLRSVDRDPLDRAALLEEFDLADAVTSRESGYDVAVEAYLELASDLRGDEWRLVNRPLDDGRVPVAERELDRLIERAIEARVAADLPMRVPAPIAEPLEDDVAAIREALAEQDLTREIDTVVPELFPPCMQALLDQIRSGEHLEHHSRFAITAFLAEIGLSTDEIVDLYEVNPGFGEEMTRYQTDHIRGDSSPTQYSPPSCATMQSYGDCVNKDDLCDTISHPLAYYEAKLDDADEDELQDWREQEA